jgi:hypothetical protein
VTTNITQGNIAEFIARFQDTDGNVYFPPLDSVRLELTYPVGGNLVPVSIPMISQGYYFTAKWNSNVSVKGVVPWTVTSASTNAPMSGELRVV